MDDDVIGYKKPPKHSRFQRGQSGNPKGRPRSTSNFKTDVINTLTAEVRLTQDGKQRRALTQEALLLQLRVKALKGNARALDRLLALGQTHNNDETPAETADILSASDAAILENFKQRLLRQYGIALPAANGPAATERGEK